MRRLAIFFFFFFFSILLVIFFFFFFFFCKISKTAVCGLVEINVRTAHLILTAPFTASCKALATALGSSRIGRGDCNVH